MPNFRHFGILGFAVFALAMLSSATSVQAAPPPIVGLFTDYGLDDPYVAQLKGTILTIDPTARLLDINHGVNPFNLAEGAYLLDQSAEEFPAGTIFVAVVDPGVGADRDPVLLETAKNKFYLGPDNGLFTQVIAREGFSRAWKLDKPQFFRSGDLSHTLHGRDIFGPVAAHLAADGEPDRLGTPVKALTLLQDKEPTFSGGLITVEIVHVDRFGNVILNLSSDNEFAANLKEGDLVKITIGHENFSAPLVKTYGEVERGRLLLTYGGNGLLEIGVNQGSAARQLKVEAGASVFLKP